MIQAIGIQCEYGDLYLHINHFISRTYFQGFRPGDDEILHGLLLPARLVQAEFIRQMEEGVEGAAEAEHLIQGSINSIYLRLEDYARMVGRI